MAMQTQTWPVPSVGLAGSGFDPRKRLFDISTAASNATIAGIGVLQQVPPFVVKLSSQFRLRVHAAKK
jgi:hypothetical protein